MMNHEKKFDVMEINNNKMILQNGIY